MYDMRPIYVALYKGLQGAAAYAAVTARNIGTVISVIVFVYRHYTNAWYMYI